MTNIPEYVYGERRKVVGWIPEDQYVSILDNMPIFCVDTLVEDSKGAFLLGERLNRPFKGMFFTVGGKKSRNETWVEASYRHIKITDEEKSKMYPVGDLKELFWVAKEEILSDKTEKKYMAPIVDAIKALDILKERGVC